ncbi:MAG: aminoglycoside phosphotransferase, partial [Sphingomonas bacterium]|nr:aminoglycoside phosphotransferase [Sphingomonas bacterium]
IGSQPRDIVDGDAQLTRFIERAGPDQDAALTRLLHRRMLRHCLVIAGPGANADHIALAKIEPILDCIPA